MAAQPRPPLFYRFGPYQVDVAAGQLRKDDRRVRLAGHPLEILILLLEQPGAVVSREQIQERLWSQETFVDFENSLNKAINKLRQALNDSSEHPTFIETLPRRGYRFLASVQRETVHPVSFPDTSVDAASSLLIVAPPEPATLAGAALQPPLRQAFAPRFPWKPLLAVSAAILLLALAAFAFFPTAPRVLKIYPLTNSARADAYGRLQTDGVRLFFLQRRGHRWENSQMPIAGGSIQPFPTPFPNARIVAVSPDSSEFLLAPFQSRDRLFPLWIVASVGGEPRRLGEVLASDATYTPDGSQITFCNDEGIFQIGRDGLNSHQLVNAAGHKSSLAWSANGKELRFDWIASPSQDGFQIWSVRSDASGLHPVFPNWADAPTQCCGRFSRDGKLYIFQGYSSAHLRSLYVRREGRGIFAVAYKPVRLDTGAMPTDEPLLGPDPRRLFVLGNDSRTEYVHFDPASQRFSSLLAGDSAVWLNISRDMAWAAYRGMSNSLWISKLDGTQRRNLVAGALSPELPAFRPNSQELVFSVTSPGSTIARICAMSVDGGELRYVVSEPYSALAPSWSPDGSKMLYSIDSDQTPDSGLFVLDWDSKQKQKIPGSEGYWKSRWSPDGKFIAGVTEDSKLIGLFNVATGKWNTLLHGEVFSPLAWSADSQFLFYQDLIEQDQPVRKLNIKTLHSEVAVECKPLLEGGVSRCAFEDVLPDGSILLQLTRGDHDVFAVDLDLR